MVRKLEVQNFLSLGGDVPIIDVRSEGEFAAGHIPGAVSMPLFNNAERAEVGTLYKQQGQRVAILKGLQYAGARMSDMAAHAIELATAGKIAVHCWRGGMRSGSVAWLFERVGLDVSVLTGGYKAFRRQCRAAFAVPRKLIVIGGKTGSQKTKILLELAARGVQVVDLEGLANHRGSAFGRMPLHEPVTALLSAGEASNINSVEGQPTQEQFENELGIRLMQMAIEKPLLVEDESRLIGRMHIPDPFWQQMRLCPVYVLDWSLEDRVQFLCSEYQAPADSIRENLNAIRKRLGPERHKTALAALEVNDRAEICRIILDYYDRAYSYGLSQRKPESISNLPGETAANELFKLICSKE